MKNTTNSVLNAIRERGYITEREINLLKGRENRGEDTTGHFYCARVSAEQTEKGKKWILTRLAKKNGTPRKGLERFAELINLAQCPESKFTFEGFANAGHFSYFAAPVYRLSNGPDNVAYYCTGQGIATII